MSVVQVTRYGSRALAAAILCLVATAAAGQPGQPGPAPVAPGAKKPKVAAITVNGNRLIAEGVVRDAMRLRVGDDFDGDALQRDVNALFGLGWFKFSERAGEPGCSQVRARENAKHEIEITVDLVENPEVAAIDQMGLAENERLPADVLASELGYVRVGRPLNTNSGNLDRTLVRLAQLYADRLNLKAKVDLPPPDANPPGFEVRGDKVTVHFRVTKTDTPATPGTPPTPPEPGGTTPTPPRLPGTPPTPGTNPPTPPSTPSGPGTFLPDIRLRISKIQINGLKTVKASVVEQLISCKEGQMFDPKKAAEDTSRIRALGVFYFQEDREFLTNVFTGYPLPPPGQRGSRIETVPDADGQGVTLVYQLVEHPTITAIEIKGNTLFKSQLLLSKPNYLQVGRPFRADDDSLRRDFRQIAEVYEAAGYRAFIDPGGRDRMLLTPTDGGVKVSLAVVEAKVGEITFDWEKGKQKTKPVVFRAYMKTRTGDFYNLETIQHDIREVARLEIVDSFTLSFPRTAVDPKDPSRLNLVFKVVEKRTGNIGAGGGLSSRYGIVGFVDLSENNLWGLAHRAAFRIEAGGRFNANINYFYPLLDGQGTELNFRVYSTDDKTGATGIGAFTNRRESFNQTRQGGSISLTRPLTDTIRGSVGYKFENVSTQRRGSLLPNLPPFPFQDVGSDSTSSVTLSVTHDTRDYPFDATRGSLQSASLEWAGLGGDNNFQKYRLENRYFLPLLREMVKSGRREPRPAWVLASRAALNWSTGRLPFSQSYFVGGADTLRGYSEDRFFGNRSFLFNMELRRALPSNIQAVAFFDAGRAWRQGEPLNPFKDLASSIGLGLRVTTPLGPIRLDYGFGGEGNKLHFSFGQSF